ncbi:unnamed protein product, partial [Phaeothamnion confervicola]
LDPAAEEIFYGERVPFEALGLGPELCMRLSELGLETSTAVQATAVPRILAGKDVVIGAETGSGKTLAYLMPLLQRLLLARDAPEPTPEPPEELLGGAQAWCLFPDAIVLLPNRELCEQVVAVANSLLAGGVGGGGGGSTQNSETDRSSRVVTAAAAYGGLGWPYGPGRPAPTLLVCTPQLLDGYGSLKNIPPFVK